MTVAQCMSKSAKIILTFVQPQSSGTTYLFITLDLAGSPDIFGAFARILGGRNSSDICVPGEIELYSALSQIGLCAKYSPMCQKVKVA